MITKQFGGRERTFKFGVRSNLILAELIDMDKLGADFVTGVKSTPAMFLAGLVAYGEKENGVTVKTDLDQIYDWILDMDDEDAADVLELGQQSMGFTKLNQIVAERKAKRVAEKAS